MISSCQVLSLSNSFSIHPYVYQIEFDSRAERGNTVAWHSTSVGELVHLRCCPWLGTIADSYQWGSETHFSPYYTKLRNITTALTVISIKTDGTMSVPQACFSFPADVHLQFATASTTQKPISVLGILLLMPGDWVSRSFQTTATNRLCSAKL